MSRNPNMIAQEELRVNFLKSSGRFSLKYLVGGILAAATALLAWPAMAAGTAAGTLIPNSVTLTYSTSVGVSRTATAASPVISVAEIINVVVTLQDSTPLPVNSPDTGRAIGFVVTNTGNGTQTYLITRNNALGGDQFDPTNAPAGAIYLESGGQPGLQTSGPNADILYVPGVNNPTLAPDTSRVVYLVSNIPPSLATGANGNVSLSASSTTPGAAGSQPGTSLPGAGPGGTDAVVGTSRAQASAIGSYLVSGVAMSLVKTVASVRDPAGGSRVMPGSVLTYHIVLTLGGTGIAQNLSFIDPLPANTTYVPDSITIDGAANTDAADGDGASFSAGVVTISFGSVPAPATRVIEFKATIN